MGFNCKTRYRYSRYLENAKMEATGLQKGFSGTGKKITRIERIVARLKKRPNKTWE